MSYKEMQKKLKEYRSQGFPIPKLNSKKEVLADAIHQYECHELRQKIWQYQENGYSPSRMPRIDDEYIDHVRFFCKVDPQFRKSQMSKRLTQAWAIA